MTTTVKIHVGGKYRAHVEVAHADGARETHTIEGDGAETGEQGASSERTINLRHPADATFKISEEPIE